MKHSKKYVEAAKKILPDMLYPVDDAMKLVKETSVTKFDATVEVAMRLNVDPRKADQMVRGTVNLPHGTGKTQRVLVLRWVKRQPRPKPLAPTRLVATS